MKIGICGQGFVGTAVREGMRDFFDLATYDKFKTEDFAVESLAVLARDCEIIAKKKKYFSISSEIVR